MKKRKDQAVQPMTPVVPPQLLSVVDVAHILSIGRTKVYHLIKNGDLPTIKVGSATRISAVALAKWIEQHEQAS